MLTCWLAALTCKPLGGLRLPMPDTCLTSHLHTTKEGFETFLQSAFLEAEVVETTWRESPPVPCTTQRCRTPST